MIFFNQFRNIFLILIFLSILFLILFFFTFIAIIIIPIIIVLFIIRKCLKANNLNKTTMKDNTYNNENNFIDVEYKKKEEKDL